MPKANSGSRDIGTVKRATVAAITSAVMIMVAPITGFAVAEHVVSSARAGANSFSSLGTSRGILVADRPLASASYEKAAPKT